MRGYPPRSSGGRRSTGNKGGTVDLGGATPIDVALNAGNDVLLGYGNDLIDIVKNSKNYSQAVSRVDKLKISDDMKNWYKGQLEEYYKY